MTYPFHVRGPVPRYQTTSPGEDLWFALRDLKVAIDNRFPSEISLQLTDWAEADGALAHYVSDLTVGHAVHRLIKRAAKFVANEGIAGEAIHSPETALLVSTTLREYLVENMGISFLDEGVLRAIPPIVYSSFRASKSSISDETRYQVLLEVVSLNGGSSVPCYCCGSELWTGSTPWAAITSALDHIWPRSLGGVSKPPNLLPICEVCNDAKSDRMSWGSFGVVHDYAAALNAKGAELLLQLALHRRAAHVHATKNACTLKESYFALGPFQSLTHRFADEPKTFFNLFAHDTSTLADFG